MLLYTERVREGVFPFAGNLEFFQDFLEIIGVNTDAVSAAIYM